MKTKTSVQNRPDKKCYIFFITFLFFVGIAAGQDLSYRLYPQLYDSLPLLSSPFTIHDTTETILVVTKNNQYGIITCTGRPNAYSISGFMADDEDIISVLKGDNKLVQAMGLTQPQMAKPLFHVWNLILLEYEPGNWGRFYEGHTDYRCDPIAIAFIFGLKSIEEIDTAFEGNLYVNLKQHFTSN